MSDSCNFGQQKSTRFNFTCTVQCTVLYSTLHVLYCMVHMYMYHYKVHSMRFTVQSAHTVRYLYSITYITSKALAYKLPVYIRRLIISLTTKRIYHVIHTRCTYNFPKL